jgi:hypothetical protein
VTQPADRLLPVAQPESDEFWAAARENRLLVQRCSECRRFQFYPRRICTSCGSREVAWEEASGRATLYTFAIVHRAPHPAFAGDVPYVAAMVELEEGVRMPSQIVGVAPEPGQLRIGMPLRATFEKASGEITLPKFTPE